MPGYNVMELVPGEILKSLEYSYAQLGYEQLPLLSKTDYKWLLEAWGTPKKHTTLHKYHREVWDNYENELFVQLKKRDDKLIGMLQANPEAAETLLGSSLLGFTKSQK